MTGIILTVGGMWIRLIVVLSPNFMWVLIGQVVAGIGSPMLLNAAAKVGTTWFPASERALATSLGAVFLQVGNAIAFKLPTWYFKDPDDIQTDADIAEGRNAMKNYLWMYAIVGSVCLVLTVIFMRNKPKIPPSKTATVERGPLCQNLKVLFKNCNFIVMLIGYTLIYGVYTIFGACVSIFTDKYGFSTVSFPFFTSRVKLETLLLFSS